MWAAPEKAEESSDLLRKRGGGASTVSEALQKVVLSSGHCQLAATGTVQEPCAGLAKTKLVEQC